MLSEVARLGSVISRTFDIESLQIQVLLPETDPGGPTFVLVHGLGVAASYFEPLAGELRTRGRVVAVNLPGFGPTKDPDRAVRISQFARVAREAVSRSGIGTAVWVGHSMGTQVVGEAVAQDPAIASKVVLLSPVVNRRERKPRVLAWRFARSAARESLPSAAATVRALLGSGLRSLLRTFPIMVSYPIEERIRAIKAETVLITGELDETAPRDWLEFLAGRVSGTASIHVLDDAAHQAMYTRPGTVAGLIVGAAPGA